MKYCENCGAELDEGAKFCSSCGSKVAEEPKFCEECGSPVSEFQPDGGTSQPSGNEPLNQEQEEVPSQENFAPYQFHEAQDMPGAGQTYIPPQQDGTYIPPVEDPPRWGEGTREEIPYSKPPVPPQAGGPNPTAPGGKKKNHTALIVVLCCVVLFLIMAVVAGVMLFKNLDIFSLTPEDPNEGVYYAVSAELMGIEVEVEDMWEGGFTIELEEDGVCILTADGVEAEGIWYMDDIFIHIEGGGLSCDGTLMDDVMILDDVMDLGLTLTFQKSSSSTVPSALSDTKMQNSNVCYLSAA